MTTPFKLSDDLPKNGTLIQASAGTGKTYTVAAIVTLALAEDPGLRIGNVLVTTFTRPAAAELKHRIRSRIAGTARLLRGDASQSGAAGDELDARLMADHAVRSAKARRLERALAEFDTSTIGTIHSVCASVLRMAGTPMSESGNEDNRKQVVGEVVNDAIIAATVRAGTAGQPSGPEWNENGLRELVDACLGDPYILPWYDAQAQAGRLGVLEQTVQTVRECVLRVQGRMSAMPSFDDSLRLARDAIKGDDVRRTSFRESLQSKFRLAIVDEAQDTSRLQWEFLHLLFPPGLDGERRLFAVGDPKQAIYGFRGADVTAFLRFAQGDGVQADLRPPSRTLRVNYRSDGPLVAGLNTAMANAMFGEGIPYESVEAEKSRSVSRVTGLRPVEFIDVGESSLENVAVARVHELLTTHCFLDGEPRPFRPREICVISRFNAVGAAIATRLGRLHIPAVTTGTASVMQGQAAEDLRVILHMMARPSDTGRARRAGATVFFGRPFTEGARLSDDELQAIQEHVAGWNLALQRKGVAAMAGAMMTDPVVAKRLASGRDGERHVVDFGHVIELLHDMSDGRGATARVVLEHFADLAKLDHTNELVSRRVESDEDAVRIMTVHAAKGLEFPAIVVVDEWSEKQASRQRGTAVFYDGVERLLDVGLAVSDIGTSAAAKERVTSSENEELRRLLYVAVTRPRHHLSVLRTAAWRDSLLGKVMAGAPVTAVDVPSKDRETIAVRRADELPEAREWLSPGLAEATKPLEAAELPVKVEQTYRRTSFSSITQAVRGEADDPHALIGHGGDEPTTPDDDGDDGEGIDVHTPGAVVDDSKTAPHAADTGVLAGFAMPTLPGGTGFGTTVHDILELLDVTADQSPEEITSAVRSLVEQEATSRALRERHDDLTAMIVAAVHTPFGGPKGGLCRDLRLVDFAKKDRLAEMDFEMGMAGIDGGVFASDVGRVLQRMLRSDDPLLGYAGLLAGPSFDVPLAGLINGQIDAVLRLPGRPADDPRLIIADYKTNTLHGADDVVPLAAYSRKGMAREMAHAHYPLQALVYGTAVWRMLRWRLGPRKPADWEPGDCIAGIVYAFVRGMKGPDTPADAEGRRYGVFTWEPPCTIWRRLSDVLAGDLAGVRT